jgi:hypothetical protein
LGYRRNYGKKQPQQIVAVISANIEDFMYFIGGYLMTNSIPYKRINNKTYETDTTRYYALTISSYVRGMSPNKIVETPRAYENKEYGDIIDVCKVYLSSGQKIEHDL